MFFENRCATLNGLDMGVGYGQACDMWSCGVVLYILVCQGMPFSTEEGTEMEEATAVSGGKQMFIVLLFGHYFCRLLCGV